jgi:hypothetical protein
VPPTLRMRSAIISIDSSIASEIDAKNLKQWVRKLLIRYLDNNQYTNKP